MRSFKTLAKQIAKFLDDNKATDVIILDVKGSSDITDYFVIATGRSNTHIAATADKLKQDLKEKGITYINREGYDKETRWVVVDYVGVIVHILTEETREHYQLEHNWEKAKIVAWEKSDAKK